MNLLAFREVAGFRHKIEEMCQTVSEMTAQVKEMTRDKDTNILVHGLPTQVLLLGIMISYDCDSAGR